MAVQIKVLTDKTGLRPPVNEGAFDCLRLLAALGVLFSHCYPLVGQGQAEPCARLTGGFTLGTLAVYAFFAMSGYLVSQSWARDPSLPRFLIRRCLRILPGLFFVITASFLVLGPIATTHSLHEYFARPDAYSYLAKIFIYPGQYGLPGVFDDNPLPHVVNGSLWTLRLEFALYVIIGVLGWLGFMRWRMAGIGLMIFFLAGYGAVSYGLGSDGIGNDGIPSYAPLNYAGFFGSITHAAGLTEALSQLSAHRQILDFFANACSFAVGVALAQNRIESGRGKLLALALILGSAATFYTRDFIPAILLLSFPCLVLLAAHHLQCHRGRMGDCSYGLYLWGFPVEQLIIHWFAPLSVAELFMLAVPLTLAMAILSWHLIEMPALRFKPRRE
ncbi:MAG: acyltransferase [Pseudomonadota bacterium]|nr:acyltransferase [Pseudomonadota bacterium]